MAKGMLCYLFNKDERILKNVAYSQKSQSAPKLLVNLPSKLLGSPEAKLRKEPWAGVSGWIKEKEQVLEEAFKGTVIDCNQSEIQCELSKASCLTRTSSGVLVAKFWSLPRVSNSNLYLSNVRVAFWKEASLLYQLLQAVTWAGRGVRREASAAWRSRLICDFAASDAEV